MPPFPSSGRLKIDILVAPRLSISPSVLRKLKVAAWAAFDHLPSKLQIPASLTVLLSGNEVVRKLNRDFRGIDKPTNVLSFPQALPAEIVTYGKKNASYYLGDIAISYPYIVVEAKRTNKILINHAAHLMIHGLLHLFGYDHIIDRDALRMEKLEKKVMAALGLPDPYCKIEPMEPKRTKVAHKKKRRATRRPKI